MPPAIASVSSGSWTSLSEDDRDMQCSDRLAGVLHGALGQGQVSSLREELILPRFIAPRALSIRTGLPRFAGGIVSVAASGYELMLAFKSDQIRNDSSYRDTRRQLVTSALSTSAGLGVGSAAGVAAAGALIAGAPLTAATAIGIAGILGAGVAASYVHDWAGSRVPDWIR